MKKDNSNNFNELPELKANFHPDICKGCNSLVFKGEYPKCFDVGKRRLLEIPTQTRLNNTCKYKMERIDVQTDRAIIANLQNRQKNLELAFQRMCQMNKLRLPETLSIE